MALTAHFSKLVFLFYPASTNYYFDSVFADKTYGHMLFTLLASAAMFYNPFESYSHYYFILANLDSDEAIKCTPNSPLRSVHGTINFLMYPQVSL